jgi:hypothetical protein
MTSTACYCSVIDGRKFLCEGCAGKLQHERDALRERLADAMDEGRCIGSGDEGDGCGYVGKSGEVCPRCNGMVLSEREEKIGTLSHELEDRRTREKHLRKALQIIAGCDCDNQRAVGFPCRSAHACRTCIARAALEEGRSE